MTQRMEIRHHFTMTVYTTVTEFCLLSRQVLSALLIAHATWAVTCDGSVYVSGIRADLTFKVCSYL